ncbi:MAG: hypothetical protein MZU79_05170 [Anaerotruncus sp.]|nr:hypothetical protein [Anaerotruncus sp.]
MAASSARRFFFRRTEVPRVLEDRHEPDDGVGLLEPALQLQRDVARAVVGEEHVEAFLEPLHGEGQPALAPDVLLDHAPFLLGHDLGHLLEELRRLFFGKGGGENEPRFILSQ